MQSLHVLTPPIALGALDGRYRGAVAPLVDHLSEPALNRMRIHVEIEWLIHLTDQQVVPGVRALTDAEKAELRAIVERFGEAEIEELAATERVTQHDVKAVEYFVKKRLAEIAPDPADAGLSELVHFCCTSEDINNLSYALMVQGAVEEVWEPRATALVEQLATMASDLREVPLLAHTHGQPATPTTMGKELAVLAWRLQRQLRRIEDAEFLGKFNGATGTFGAHVAAVPGADWQEISETFVEGLGLTWNPLTTQIESHDWQAELYADLARFNRVLHNLCTDVWTYISMGYFAQVRGQGTVGSSTMPHKVNPIRFENAEANLEVSNALFDVLASTLVQSRLQRDLTDSSMQRNIDARVGQHRAWAGRSRCRARRHGGRPRCQLGGARRGDPVGHACARGAGCAGHGGAVRAAQGPHARAPGGAAGGRGVHRHPRAAGRRGGTPGGDDARDVCRPRAGAGRPPRLIDHLGRSTVGHRSGPVGLAQRE